MAEKEGLDEKDLALQELEKFEIKMLEQIENLKEGESAKVPLGKDGNIFLEIRRDKDGGQILLLGEEFATINKDKITYNKEFISALEKSKSINLKQLGLPTLEDIERMEEMRQEQQRDEEGLSKDIEEKEKDNKKPGNEETKDGAKKESDGKQNNKKDTTEVVKTNPNRKMAGRNGIGNIDPKAKNGITVEEDNKRIHNYRISTGEENQEPYKQPYGTNPSIKILMVEKGKQTKEISPKAMFAINKTEGYAIVLDHGREEAVYYRVSTENKLRPIGVTIPEKQRKKYRYCRQRRKRSNGKRAYFKQ